MLSRRAFLIGTASTAAGLILPSWLVRAENFIEAKNKPYLEPPRVVNEVLYAMDWGFGEYQLTLGDPYESPPAMTWRQYLDEIGCESFEEYYGSDDTADFPDHGLDDIVDEAIVMDLWIREGSPDARAFDYLYWKDLGGDFGGKESAGEITFYDGVSPGNDSRIVTVPDLISLSLLQKQLNEIDGTVSVKIFKG